MATKPINELDFAAIKDQFIAHLKNQTQFKDYDFTGSNMNVLLDVLSYNTYMNNFYTNMAINEMFLDSAVLKNSVVSHAKELNYLPRSRTSAKAVVNVRIENNSITTQTVEIPRFTRFTTNYQSTNYTFITNEVYVARKISPGVFVATNVEIFEGDILTNFEKDGFFLDEQNFLRCNLANDNIDVNTIEVYVDDEATEGQNQFFYTKDIFGVAPTSKVFYLDPYFDDRYTVYFGRNIYGEQPEADIDIKIQYRVCSGAEPNGASRFSSSFTINGVTITPKITTVQAAAGGSERESIDSIKFFAPKSIQIQERAITANDYEILLRQRFPEIQSVSVYGGDELDPPQYGRVAISINLQGQGILSTTNKNEYIRYLANKSPIAIEPIFVNPEFLYVETILDVVYSRKSTNKSEQQLEALIRDAIRNYNDTNLDDFGETLRSSRLSTVIDSVDDGIVGNSLCVNPIIEYAPVLNLTLNPRFRFETALVKPYPFRLTSGFADFKPAVVSSTFTYRGVLSKLQDDGAGNMQIISADTVNTQILDPTIGTVDYTTGDIKLINFAVQSFTGSAIKIYAASTSSDVVAPKSRILTIRDEDILINFIEDK
jgi:hypothetical protein